MNGRPFAPREDATLRKMWAAGRSSVEIGKALGRRDSTVRRRAGVLGLTRRDDAERDALAVRGRKRQRSVYAPEQESRDVNARIANINAHFDWMKRRLGEIGRELDAMLAAGAVVLFLVLGSAPALAAQDALWHVWPFDPAPHRKTLAGDWLPKGVVHYDYYLHEVRGTRHLLVRAANVDAAKAEFTKAEPRATFTRQPFRRPPPGWVPTFYVDPACQHLRGIYYSERHCAP
jgi:hypothetical protein